MRGKLTRLFNRLAGNETPERQKHKEVLLDLTSAFLKAVLPQPVSASGPEKEGQYSLYMGNMSLGILDSRHLYVRLVNPQGVTECEIHGTQIKVDGASRLCAVIEPLDHEYFSHLKQDKPALIWQGNAEEAAQKMRRAAHLVAKINEAPQSYNILFRNCNTILRSVLQVMDLTSPLNPAGWTPGYSFFYKNMVEKVRQDVRPDFFAQHDSEKWLGNFLKEIRNTGAVLKERTPEFKPA